MSNQNPSEQPTQANHVVDGRQIAHGHKVHYTSEAGEPHEATIDHVHGGSDNRVNLTAHVDGDQKKFTSVPYSAVGGKHTWSHAPGA